MEKQKFDILNLLKYAMVLVFIAYIVFLNIREGGNSTPVKTIRKVIMAVTKEDGMTKGTTQDLKKYYGLNADDYDLSLIHI